MTHHAIRVPLRLSGLAVAAFLLAATPAGVAATTNPPIAQTGGMTATLPLLGTPLTVAVTLDSVGNISGVALDPSTALSKTKSGDDFVKFSNNDGTVKVTVKAIDGRLSIKAKAKTLSDLVGKGPGLPMSSAPGRSTAYYTVGRDPSGKPTVAIGAVHPAAGVAWKLGPFVATKVTPSTAKSGAADKGKAKGAHAAADGTFSWQGFTKSLTISINVAGDGTASMAITLSGRDAQKLNGTLASLAGARTWSAHTCAGTAVSVKYHVASNGTVVYDGATGATRPPRRPSEPASWPGSTRVAPASSANLVAEKDGTYSPVRPWSIGRLRPYAPPGNGRFRPRTPFGRRTRPMGSSRQVGQQVQVSLNLSSTPPPSARRSCPSRGRRRTSGVALFRPWPLLGAAAGLRPPAGAINWPSAAPTGVTRRANRTARRRRKRAACRARPARERLLLTSTVRVGGQVADPGHRALDRRRQ